MKKIFAAAAVALAFTVPAFGQQSLDNPVTKAMMEVYDQALTENPKDFEIYFRRANEYYKFNQYLRALSDCDKALEYTPASNSGLRYQLYMLRADIYQMLGKHQEALDDFNAALKIDPASYMALYQKGNEEYTLGNYAEAKAAYTRMRSLNPRSAEALTGLARVAVKENNIGLASEYMDGAVAMMSADPDIYIRRASVRRMQGNNTGAVEDLLMSLSIDSNKRAMQELIDLANSDYPSVIAGLSSSITLAPKQGMLYFIRAIIAQTHEHYANALTDYGRLVDDSMYSYPGMYNSMARCELALCRYDKALDDVDHAISTDDTGSSDFYFTKAQVLFAQGKYQEAATAFNTAALSGNLSAGEKQFQSILYFMQKDYAKANDLLASMIIDQPDDMKSFMLRAWVLADGLKDDKGAAAMYQRIVNLTESDDTKVAAQTAAKSYRGFALLFTGDTAGASEWAASLLRDYHDTDGYLHYMAACLYAQKFGVTKDQADAELSLNALEEALKLGYGNLYELNVADFGRYSMAPVRSQTRFTDLLGRYSYLFE